MKTKTQLMLEASLLHTALKRLVRSCTPLQIAPECQKPLGVQTPGKHVLEAARKVLKEIQP